MRVSNKMIYSNFSYNFMKLEESIYKKTNQVSTGRRIQQPSDDPVGTARAMDFRSRTAEILQYIDNSEQAISWLNCTDDALMTLTNYLQRVRELVIAGTNGTLTVEAREAYANEIDVIRDGIMQVANTNIDNRFIFGGEKYLNPPYQYRTKVTGDAINFQLNPIVITDRNNMLDIKLDNGEFVTIRLTPKTYDGSPGNTLDDLANDIQLKLHYAGFDTPVYVKATPDNRLEFYAGTYPSDGIHTLVLRDGPAVKEVGKARGGAADQITLGMSAIAADDYYNGWQIKIIEGTGVGQIRTIGAYTDDRVATVTEDWGIEPDHTSVYQLLPPLEGTAAITNGGSTISLSPASDVENFYVGMEIEIYDEKRGIYESHLITGYDELTHEVTIGDSWGVTGNFKYRIKPHLEGQAVSFGANSIQLEASASMIDDFYVGASITVTNPDGSTETKLITGYEYDDTATPPTYTITVKGNWTTNVTAGSTYKISDTALAQLGFDNRATTKELLGYEVEPLIKVLAKYPEMGTVQSFTAGTPSVLTLGDGASAENDYYNNWTIKIIEPSGAVYTDRILAYNGATREAQLSITTISPGARYELVPPLDGEVGSNPVNANQIQLDTNASRTDDFYVGMPITITDGQGKSQTRIITDYDGTTGIATLDSAWGNPPPIAGSKYSIDAHSYINANNKFRIKVGNELTQEISLNGGSYNIREFARMIEEKIRARGGEYANVRVEATPDNRLRIFHQDELNNPLSITLFSGNEADALWIMGFADGVSSDTETPNYEGNKGYIEYEISTSMEIQINVIGDKLFDPIFQHLAKISQDLRANNIEALSGEDLYNIRLDIDKVLVTQGEVGAKVNRLEKGIDRLKSLNENLTKLLSNVEDVDITKAILELRMQETAYQAALQSAGRIMPMTLLDYLR
ncbi:MAG: flagellar hook-associated protein FlgL [Firmicutes bacterium]|nr:flagellar hook-associated protein FlgL [Bacillota bacterium]